VGRTLIGWSAAMKGSLDSGLESMREGLKEYGGGGLQMFAVHLNGMLAEVYLKAGRPDGASSALEKAALLEARGNVYWSAEIRRLRGELALHERSKGADAEAHFRDALEIAKGQGAKLLELRAATSLAKLWHDTGSRDEAKDLLGSIHPWFTEGFDTRDWLEAKATLDSLG
jgi:predicted ATPase